MKCRCTNSFGLAEGLSKTFTLILFVFFLGNDSSAAPAIPQFDRVLVLKEPVSIQDVELSNQDGNSFSLGDLRGTVALVFFGFTNCPDVCPTTMARLQSFWATTDFDPTDLAIVMISVDGDRDTPDRMREFLSRFSSDFIGLTGDPAMIKKMAKQFRASFYKGSVNAEDGSYTVAHTPQVFVVDAAGRLRAELYNASDEAVSGVVDALLIEGRANGSSSQAEK